MEAQLFDLSTVKEEDILRIDEKQRTTYYKVKSVHLCPDQTQIEYFCKRFTREVKENEFCYLSLTQSPGFGSSMLFPVVATNGFFEHPDTPSSISTIFISSPEYVKSFFDNEQSVLVKSVIKKTFNDIQKIKIDYKERFEKFFQ